MKLLSSGARQVTPEDDFKLNNNVVLPEALG